MPSTARRLIGCLGLLLATSCSSAAPHPDDSGASASLRRG